LDDQGSEMSKSREADASLGTASFGVEASFNGGDMNEDESIWIGVCFAGETTAEADFSLIMISERFLTKIRRDLLRACLSGTAVAAAACQYRSAMACSAVHF
jgi:hypothetical protein